MKDKKPKFTVELNDVGNIIIEIESANEVYLHTEDVTSVDIKTVTDCPVLINSFARALRSAVKRQQQ